MERNKRKLEGEFKVASETIDELHRTRLDMESRMKAKDMEMSALQQRLEDEQAIVSKAQRYAKDLQSRVTALEEALESEKQNRARVGQKIRKL